MSEGSSVLSERHQQKWKNQPIYNNIICSMIDPGVQLHTELLNVRSSAAACLNTLGNIALEKKDLINFLNSFGTNIDDIILFPTGISVGNEIYNDSGYVIFEWIGPKNSPLNEKGGKRGQNRTSIDAFVLAMVNGKLTQLLIEWKLTETYDSLNQLHKFAGIVGNERLRRYASCLAVLRRRKDYPFRMDYEDKFGLCDFGYEPYFQLLRMTLLAKLTTPMILNDGLRIEDYRVVHLTHSMNTRLNNLSRKHLSYCPGLKEHIGKSLHEVWGNIILSEQESQKFIYGYWNEALSTISNIKLQGYLIERYG